MSPFVLETLRVSASSMYFPIDPHVIREKTTKQTALHRQFINSLQTIQQENSLSYPFSEIKE